MTLLPGVTVSGAIDIERGGQLPSQGMFVPLRGAGGAGFTNAGGRPGQDGRFTIRGVRAGDYPLELRGGMEHYYVKSATFGAEPVLTAPIEIRHGAEHPPLAITLSARGARLAGQVSTARGEPLPGAAVVLVPDDRDDLRRYQDAVTDQAGVFGFRSVAPGKYRLFAWEFIEPGAWMDPVILDAYEHKSVRVEVREDDALQIDLRAILLSGS